MEDQPHSSDNPADPFVAANLPARGETAIDGHASPAAPRQLADDQLIVLHEVAKYLAQNRSLPEILSLIAEKACFLTSSASSAVCLLDEARETLEFAAVAGRGAGEMAGQKVRVADALPGQTALTGEPLLAYNPEQARRASARGKTSFRHGESEAEYGFADSFDEQVVRSGGVRSAAVVPIVVGPASMGSLAAINRLDGQSFTGSDLLVLQILAASASTAIQKDFLGRQSNQRERERNILFRVAQNTGASLDVQRILDGTMESLCYSVDARAVIIFLQNDDRTHLYIAAQSGLTNEQQEIQLLSDGKLARSALSGTGKALIVDEPERDETYEELLPLGGAPVQSMIVVPMNARESAVGLIVAVSRQKGAYSDEDKALLAAIGAQTALALENATLYEDATRRAGEATTIYELSQTVNSDFNLARVLSYVADSILALLQVDKFALFLYNPERRCLEIKVSRNLSRETARTMCPSPERRGIAWWVYEYETPTAVQDVAADFRNRSWPLEGDGVASLVSVPLQAGDSVIGVIHAMSSRRRAFTVAEMELLYTIANQVGIAVFNIQAAGADPARFRRAAAGVPARGARSGRVHPFQRRERPDHCRSGGGDDARRAGRVAADYSGKRRGGRSSAFDSFIAARGERYATAAGSVWAGRAARRRNGRDQQSVGQLGGASRQAAGHFAAGPGQPLRSCPGAGRASVALGLLSRGSAEDRAAGDRRFGNLRA